MNIYILYSYSKDVLKAQIAAIRQFSIANIIVIEDDPYNNTETPLEQNEIEDIRIICSGLDKYKPTDWNRRKKLYQIALKDMEHNPTDYYMLLHMDCYPVAPIVPDELLDGHSMAGIRILSEINPLRFLGPWAIWKEINDDVKVWGESGNNCDPIWIHTHHISIQNFPPPTPKSSSEEPVKPPVKAQTLLDWKKKIQDNKWIETLPLDLKTKVKNLRSGCNCNKAKRIMDLVPEMSQYLT